MRPDLLLTRVHFAQPIFTRPRIMPPIHPPLMDKGEVFLKEVQEIC